MVGKTKEKNEYFRSQIAKKKLLLYENITTIVLAVILWYKMKQPIIKNLTLEIKYFEIITRQNFCIARHNLKHEHITMLQAIKSKRKIAVFSDNL